MPKTIDQFEQRAAQILQDAGAKLKPADLSAAVLQAILQVHSKYRPQELVSDVAGNGTALLALPTHASGTFEDGFSRVTEIEHPPGKVPPSTLEGDQWQMYRTPSALQVMLLESKPAATETARMTWTARHKDDGSTIPEPHFEAVCDAAAALGFEMLAAAHAQTGDSTMDADTVNYRSKSQEYTSLAKKAMGRYLTYFGIDPEDSRAEAGGGAAIAIGEIDGSIGGSGVDRLTHPGKWR